MKAKYWECPKCQVKVNNGENTVFKCPQCGFEPEMENYKEAFDELMRRYSEKSTEMLNAMNTFRRASEIDRNMCKVLSVISIILFILLILSLLL